MTRAAVTLLPFVAAAGLLGLTGEAAPEVTAPPLDLGKSESVRVRLLLLDVVVVDQAGRTVPGLTAEDFEVVSRGKPTPVDTLDIHCPAGAVEEPRSVRRASDRPPLAPSASARRVVLALDYQHLPPVARTEVLQQAKDMVARGTPGQELMVVALTGGLRIEQPFTSDPEEVVRSLRRMESDVSLWQPSFDHMSEAGFVRGLNALFDVLGTVSGAKAVVLYSAMADVPLDLQFREIAANATAARCSIYPVDVRGLTVSPPPSPASTSADIHADSLANFESDSDVRVRSDPLANPNARAFG